MGRSRTTLFLSRLAAHLLSPKPTTQPNNHFLNLNWLTPTNKVSSFRGFSTAANPVFDGDEHKYARDLFVQDQDESAKVSVRAIFLCTSVDLKGLQVELSGNVVRPTSRSTNHTALKFCNYNPDYMDNGVEKIPSSHSYMVVFQYGSAVLFNVEDHEVDSYLSIIKRHASGSVLKDSETRNDAESRNHMERKKLFQLVGKANSNLADVILRVGLFDRSEIAWRAAKYAQIYEYLREEYEVAQRFGNLDYKLKFVEHNIHFLQEALQNRKSDLLEWCIIVLLSIENIIGIYEIIRETNIVLI
ncbi:protein RETARDED ROOT GROWTH, mitochondrial-like [Bidens hawaiensis]|uniref:protein RETARDED ROOT GROWTH, mitochondrial-like n=1 Tax=Bidens hawaiensis TaxID=980011 RepID=UPI00404AB343